MNTACKWCGDGMTEICGHQAAYWERNRVDMEARYQEHLSQGVERCPCNMCRRKRGVA